eukprot:Skav235856  [mRNA]  locus=scaffold1693:157206:157879:- [translate_table: standard]
MSLARSVSLRWRGVRLHWDNAFLPLNVVPPGSHGQSHRARSQRDPPGHKAPLVRLRVPPLGHSADGYSDAMVPPAVP